MARKLFTIRPLGILGSSAQYSDLAVPPHYGLYQWQDTTTQNLMIEKRSAVKRHGLTTDKTNTGTFTYQPVEFVTKAGTAYHLFFTKTDLCKRETGGSNTFSYLTDTYTTGTISSIAADTPSAGKSTLTGSGTDWQNEGITVGDQFIMDDDHSSTVEPDANWATVESCSSATAIVLTSNYTKNGSDYKLRRVHSIGQNVNHATVADKFCFTSGDYVWYWAGSGYTTALDTTYAAKFKYCIAYADRLVLLHLDGSQPTLVQWSKNGDPTDWTDSTAGSAELITTSEEITGAGMVGANLIVYAQDSIIIGNRTGISTAPIAFNAERRGVGCWAPKSIVHTQGTNYFAGRNNFYRLDGTTPTPIGDPIAEEVFDNITANGLLYMFGVHNERDHEIMWTETSYSTTLAWNYKNKTWNMYDWAVTPKAMGIWSFSDQYGTDNVVMVASANDISKFTGSSLVDGSTAITCRWLTPETDFSDQDPKAQGKYKTVYRIRLYYRDIVTTTTFYLKIRVDGEVMPTAIDDTEIVGTGTGRIQSIDFHVIRTGNFFQFNLYEISTDKDVEWLSMAIEYEIGGDYFIV